MKVAYRDVAKMEKPTKALLEKILGVVDNYQSQGYRLTLRQLYYQLVVENVLSNKTQNYAKLSRLLGEARMTGLCDWDVIEDRLRIPRFPNEWKGIPDAMETIINVYRKQRWKDQPEYVEVWVEKDALSGVLEPITRDFHVHLLVNRGYSSISAMHDSSIRFRIATQNGKNCTLLYIGDFDPSGEDMVRDIENRLGELWANVTVEKIALTRDQIDEYSLPPNPAKLSDPRSSKFINENGAESWEVDALPPTVLDALLRGKLEEHLNRKMYENVITLEDEDKEKIKRFSGKES